MKIKLVVNYFARGHHYLAYQASEGFCGFGIKNEAIKNAIKDKNLTFAQFVMGYKDDFKDVSLDIFSRLQELSYKERNIEYKGIWFPRETPKVLADFFIDNIGNKVQVSLKPGHESFTDDILDCGKDGDIHTFTIGKSLGTYPILLAVYGNDLGGSSLDYKGIDKYRAIC